MGCGIVKENFHFCVSSMHVGKCVLHSKLESYNWIVRIQQERFLILIETGHGLLSQVSSLLIVDQEDWD